MVKNAASEWMDVDLPKAKNEYLAQLISILRDDDTDEKSFKNKLQRMQRKYEANLEREKEFRRLNNN